MLNEFNLINMNGRVYDPVLGRFLSPDIMYKHQVIPKVIIAMIKINRRKYSWNNLGMGAEYAMDNNTRNSLE